MSRARQRGGAIARFLRGVFLLIVLAGVAVAGYCYWQYRLFSDSPLAIEQPRTLEIAQGSSFNRIVGSLREEQLTAAHPLYWRALAWEMGVMKGLHAGEYRNAHTRPDLRRRHAHRVRAVPRQRRAHGRPGPAR